MENRSQDMFYMAMDVRQNEYLLKKRKASRIVIFHV